MLNSRETMLFEIICIGDCWLNFDVILLDETNEYFREFVANFHSPSQLMDFRQINDNHHGNENVLGCIQWESK